MFLNWLINSYGLRCVSSTLQKLLMKFLSRTSHGYARPVNKEGDLCIQKIQPTVEYVLDGDCLCSSVFFSKVSDGVYGSLTRLKKSWSAVDHRKKP